MIVSVSAVRASRQTILDKQSYSRSECISDEESDADSESEPMPSETEFTDPVDCPNFASSSVSLALSDHDSPPSCPSLPATGASSHLSSPEPDSFDGNSIYLSVKVLTSDITVEKPARKRKRHSYITSDRYVVQQGTDTNIQESSHLSTCRSQRAASTKVFYGRIKRQYIRKH